MLLRRHERNRQGKPQVEEPEAIPDTPDTPDNDGESADKEPEETAKRSRKR